MRREMKPTLWRQRNHGGDAFQGTLFIEPNFNLLNGDCLQEHASAAYFR